MYILIKKKNRTWKSASSKFCYNCKVFGEKINEWFFLICDHMNENIIRKNIKIAISIKIYLISH